MSDSDKIQPTDFFFASSIAEKQGLVFDSFNLEEIEKQVINRSMQKHTGNVSHAAKELGLTRAALYRRLEKYGI
jgi:transcriptional regulator of acetoin/glycerol metabolism